MSFSVSRSALPPNYPAGVAISLTGTSGTAWSDATTFTLVGAPSGATILRAAIISATTATVVIATGAAVGSFALSDGAHSVAMQVRRGVRLHRRWSPPPRSRCRPGPPARKP